MNVLKTEGLNILRHFLEGFLTSLIFGSFDLSAFAYCDSWQWYFADFTTIGGRMIFMVGLAINEWNRLLDDSR